MRTSTISRTRNYIENIYDKKVKRKLKKRLCWNCGLDILSKKKKKKKKNALKSLVIEKPQ